MGEVGLNCVLLADLYSIFFLLCFYITMCLTYKLHDYSWFQIKNIKVIHFGVIFRFPPTLQGYNARKVILEVYASFVLSLGDNVNTKRMSKPDMGSIFHIKNQWNILVIGNHCVNYQNLMLLASSDTKRTLTHLFLFTNSAQREPFSITL